MFVTEYDRLYWRTFCLLWPTVRGWRYRLKLGFALFEALWLQERFLVKMEREFPSSEATRP
jgi:hypothetical protein